MTCESSEYSLLFLGTGSGGHLQMGCSAACIEYQHKPLLLIDCGPGTLAAYQANYSSLPNAIFITHAHMDHIADLEILTVRARLQELAPITLFVPLALIPTLHQRLATYPGTMAEGDHDFWQSFQLRPVTDQFIHAGHTFKLYPTRHHAPNSSHALYLPGHMFFSGDTRPIPEIIHHELTGSEAIFHDCGTIPNPSHTGLDDLDREYRDDVRSRFVLYHYADEAAATKLEAAGYQVARPNERFALPDGKRLSL
jgi:ribonuclease BN (tRNA processing enzyme)